VINAGGSALPSLDYGYDAQVIATVLGGSVEAYHGTARPSTRLLDYPGFTLPHSTANRQTCAAHLRPPPNWFSQFWGNTQTVREPVHRWSTDPSSELQRALTLPPPTQRLVGDISHFDSEEATAGSGCDYALTEQTDEKDVKPKLPPGAGCSVSCRCRFTYNCTVYPEVCHNTLCYLKYHVGLTHFNPATDRFPFTITAPPLCHAHRRLSMRSLGSGGPGLDRDEAPPASTAESLCAPASHHTQSWIAAHVFSFVDLCASGGLFSRIQLIPASQNQRHGREWGQILSAARQCRSNQRKRVIYIRFAGWTDTLSPTCDACHDSDFRLNTTGWLENNAATVAAPSPYTAAHGCSYVCLLCC
jgi:hypothetical protein